MKPIELELWRPRKDDPRYAERVGQRSAEEVFRELEQRLDSMGMLPDEYFLLDMDWQEGNLPTGHRTTIRTGLPESAWRLLNYGVQPSKSVTAQVTDTCGKSRNLAFNASAYGIAFKTHLLHKRSHFITRLG